MTDREKLIDIIEEVEGQYNNDYPSLEQMADGPIARGVTIQKWIPVTERLPEKDGKYLCYKQLPFLTTGWCCVCDFAKDGRKVDEYDFATEWENVWYGYDSEWGHITSDSVTHWMPLPEAPKEDACGST